MGPVIKAIQRKEKRKMLRDLKKAKSIAFTQRKKIPTLEDLQLKKQEELQKEKEKKKKNALRNKQRKLARLKAEEEKKKKESGNYSDDDEADEESEQNARRLYYLNAIKEDEKAIKELEKKLKIKKTSKNLPKSFLADGLDYILNFTGDSEFSDAPIDAVTYDDSGSDQSDEDQSEGEDSGMGAVASDGSLDDNPLSEEAGEGETDEDFCDETSEGIEKLTKPILKRKTDSFKNQEKQLKINKKVKWEFLSDSPPAAAADTREAESSPSNKMNLREDIYGRLRDTEGNIVTKAQTSSYVPPALRKIPTNNQTDERISKQIKGIINRVNESNMAIMCEQLEELYNHNSRADLNSTLLSAICSTAIQHENTLDRLLLELAVLITIIHCNIGQEIGAYFVQELVDKLQDHRHQKQGKELNNIMTLLCCMYNFKIFHCSLIFDLMKLFIENFQEKDVEVLSIVFKFSGFELRKDDPSELKDVILSIQRKSSTVDTSTFEEPGRMRYILDTMLAVKNNNVQKGDHQDRVDLLLRLKKLTSKLIRGQNLEENQLRVRLDDLQNAETKGRWWIVGSAWKGNEDIKKPAVSPSKVAKHQGKISQELQELARKQRMNTDVRRSIFFTLMTSEDFVEAFESLLELKLKPLQEREIIHVTIDCCVQEDDYNPYYAHLLQKFCELHRRFQMTFQFNMWDKFKDINTLSNGAIFNLAQLTTHLITTKALSLALFKVVEFGAINKQMVRFLKQVLMTIFEKSPSHVIDQVFERVSCQTNLYKFREGLRLFMMHFLIGRKQKKELSPKISEYIQNAIQHLAVPHSSMLL